MTRTLTDFLPVTAKTAAEAFDWVYAPWIKEMGLTDFELREGYFAARLPQSPELQFFTDAICGQALMAAIDTVASMAVATGSRVSKGTVYQHTHFLRPATGEDLMIAAEVRRFGKASDYIDCIVTLADSGTLCTHAVLEFAF